MASRRSIRQLSDSIKSSEPLLRRLLDHFAANARRNAAAALGFDAAAAAAAAASEADNSMLKVGWPALAMRIIIGVNEAGSKVRATLFPPTAAREITAVAGHFMFIFSLLYSYYHGD